MKKLILLAALLACSTAYGQNATGDAKADAGANAGANANVGPMYWEASQPLRRQSVDTTPSVLVPGAAFGHSPEGCGQSSGIGGSATGGALALSIAGESKPCNTRADTATAARLGYKDVAAMRFFCFGGDDNRKAFEASGYLCPSTATAKGLDDNVTAAAIVPYSP